MPVPLIMLSSCSGGAAGSQAMAAGLIAQGADRVIAMLAPVTDAYATTLARHFYRELAARPGADGRAGAGPGPVPGRGGPRRAADRAGPACRRRSTGWPRCWPPAGTARWSIRSLPAVPLPVATTPPGGKLVRELPMGALIGRRAQLRTAMGVLRRTPQAVDRFGAAGGVVLTGVGGIGKTALAGRVISRLP